jgi:5-methylcytosine-specific restriction endonuclease McrA
MKNEVSNEPRLSDAELLNEVKRLTALERQATARLIAALGELDARRLYLGEGCSSLFTYCTQVLHLSEHAAYLRIEAARASRKWPGILELLGDGGLHLTAIGLLAPHLIADNHERLLGAARHKSKREVEEIVAALRPQPAVPSSVRKLPTPKELRSPTAVANQPPHCDAKAHSVPVGENGGIATRVHGTQHNFTVVKPLAPERYKVQFAVSDKTYHKLREAQNLLRHCIPDGDIAAIFERGLTLLLAELQKTRHAAVDRPRKTLPRSTGRHLPASVKRAVWERDKGQCAFVGSVGRCTERGFLEYHHRVPYADGGTTTPDNLELRCRAHNAYEAALWFGPPEEHLVRDAPGSFIAW